MTLTLVAVALSMAARDAFATLLVIAEARGRAWLAGTLDAGGDLAGVASTVFGAGEIIVHGWGWPAVEVLTVMCVTSLLGTTLWTTVGARITTREATDGTP